MIGSEGRSSGRMSNNAKRSHNKPHLEVLRNLTDKTLEWKLADEKFSRLLIATNFAEGDSSGAETMGLLYTTSDRLQMIEFMIKSTRPKTLTAEAVLRAADFAASCLRGALPGE